MPQTRYALRIAGMYPDADPQAIGEEIEQLIVDKKEHVTEEEIIAAARKHTSPMHAFITWDQEAAAHKQNKREAKRILTHLVLEKDDKPTKTRGFVFVHHPDHGGKRVLLSHRSAMGRTEFREQVIEQAVRSLQRSLTYWGQAYGGNPAFRALAKDVKQLQKKAERELLQAL
ncbi:MAG TPA: hypothetical protein VJS69_01205 [Candidatus Krumholzibacteria bacterium]|nr:hypothetical protein [Candidatus Krumholzibacteria bacterium]